MFKYILLVVGLLVGLSNNAYAVGNALLHSPANGATVLNGRPCFHWGSARGASHYTVQISSDPAFNASSKRWIKKDLTSAASCWSRLYIANPKAGFTPSSLPIGTYYWRIKSMTGVTGSPVSSVSFTPIRSFTFPAPAPSIPSINVPSSDANGRYSVSWNKPSGHPTSYQLRETSPTGTSTYTTSSTSSRLLIFPQFRTH